MAILELPSGICALNGTFNLDTGIIVQREIKLEDFFNQNNGAVVQRKGVVAIPFESHLKFEDSNIFGMLTYFFLVVGHVTRVYLMRR